MKVENKHQWAMSKILAPKIHSSSFIPLPLPARSGTSNVWAGDQICYRQISSRLVREDPLVNRFINLPSGSLSAGGLKTKRVMNNYELMVIFTPVLSDEEFKAAQKKYASLVKAVKGEVLHENAWGLKSLAYPIQKKTTGLYWVLEYTAPSDFNEKLKVQLLRDEAVLRHLITRLDKYAVEYNAKKRSGVAASTEKAVEA
jgi:small subunit ribosomal protein S6